MMYTVTTGAGTTQKATLQDAWTFGIYDDGAVTLTKPDATEQVFADYDAFTTYVEENA